MMRKTMWRVGAAMTALLAGAGAHAACTLNKLADLPVTMQGTTPLVAAKINGEDARFIVDSGAFYSIITPGAAAQHKLPLSFAPPDFFVGGVGGETNPQVARVKGFQLAKLSLSNIYFLTGGSEVGSDGLIGQNVLRIGDVEYDLGHGMISLFRPKDCVGVPLAYWAGSQPVSVLDIVPIDNEQRHTIATISINGQPIRAMFDTGASTSILSLAAAARAGIRRDSPGVQTAGSSRGLGNRMMPTWIAPVANVKIAGEELTKTHLMMGDIGLDIDMLIGADFFLAHRVFVASDQNKMYFTYQGGPIFAAAQKPVRAIDAGGRALALPEARKDDPTDAEGFSRRAAATASRGDAKAALADLDQAVKRAPQEPRYLLQRADLRLDSGDGDGARADIDKALALRPGDGDALITRASLHLHAHEREAARSDLDAAAQALAPASDSRLELGQLYATARAPDKAIGQYDLWIAAHPEDSRRSVAQNGRCWARALANRDLPKALADCNAALKALPRREMALDSRGLVELRMGDPAAAVRDYDAALAIDAKMAWSFYGRGLAKLKLGRKAEGDADLAAAEKLSPDVRAEARDYGLTP